MNVYLVDQLACGFHALLVGRPLLSLHALCHIPTTEQEDIYIFMSADDNHNTGKESAETAKWSRRSRFPVGPYQSTTSAHVVPPSPRCRMYVAIARVMRSYLSHEQATQQRHSLAMC
jgi:hypothetical protein